MFVLKEKIKALDVYFGK